MSNYSDEWTVASSKKKIFKQIQEPLTNTIIQNYKKTLCKNMGLYGSCVYGNKCKYAHNLKDQNIEPIRKQVLDYINNNDDLTHINLVEDKKLYFEFLTMTKLCYLCNDNKCSGGYNCKNGSYDKNIIICISDLNKGSCENNECNKIHLTKRGLIPFDTVFNRSIKINFIPKKEIINDDYFINESNDDLGIEIINREDNKKEIKGLDEGRKKLCSSIFRL